MIVQRVKCVETGVIFDSPKEAGDWCGSLCGVHDVLKGRSITAGGYKWEYVNVDLKEVYKNIDWDLLDTPKTGVNRLAKSFMQFYLLVEGNNHKLLTKYINKETHVLIDFNCEHGIQKVTPGKYRISQRCPLCAKKLAGAKNATPNKGESLADMFPEILKEWNYNKNKLSPYNFKPKSNKSVWWICEHGHKWETRIANRTSLNRCCPICNESKGEKEVKRVLEINNIKYETQVEFENLKGTGGGLLSYDFKVENVLIEFQGEQHYRYVKGFHKNKLAFEKQKKHDELKREYAKNNGYNMIEISYLDIDKIEEILLKIFI